MATSAAVDLSTTSAWRRWALPGATTAALAAVTAYTYVRDPHQPGMFPSCIFYAGSGYHCPGCGGLRAAHDLMHGDLAGALQMNVVVVLGIIPAIAGGMLWWLAATASSQVRRPTIPTWLAIAVPAFLMVFWVVRNLPALSPYLAPVGP